MEHQITPNLCKEYRDSCSSMFLRELGEMRRISEKRLDAHAQQNDKQDVLLKRVVTIQELLAKQGETSEKRLQLVEKQMTSYQQIQQSMQKEVNAIQEAILRNDKIKNTAPIWKEKWFGVLIVIAALIVASCWKS